MIVMKFGGTSVESAAAIECAASIVADRLEYKPVVVVSAMGKTTNKLLSAASAAAQGDLKAALAKIEELKAFHLKESSGVGSSIESQVNACFAQLTSLIEEPAAAGKLTPQITDAICAFGEQLSSIIVAAFFVRSGIKAAHVDARSVIITDDNHTQAAPLWEETNARLSAVIPELVAHQHHVPVMGGFIGSTKTGATTTLGRGGSDYTASIVGAGIGAQEIQIWTDVDGMLTADPVIFPQGYPLKICSFAEAAELAYFGAKVLHPATVLPAVKKNIPLRILNSRRPELKGTLIVSNPPADSNPIRGIASKRGICVINIVSLRMLMAHGFLHRVFEIFDKYKTPVDMLATSEISISATVDNTAALGAIQAEIGVFAEVTVEQDQSVVCLVGEDIVHSEDVAARVFTALRGIKIRMFSQGASQLNISLVLKAADTARAVELLHREFFDGGARDLSDAPLSLSPVEASAIS